MPAVTYEQARGAAIEGEWKATRLKSFNLDEAGSFHALFSTFYTVDHQGDMTIPGCFGEQRVIISAYGHGSWNGGSNALPVGKGRIFESDVGGIVEGQFFLDTVAGRETYLTVKNVDDLQQWSYSLPETEAEKQIIDGRTVRVLSRIRVNEVSPVLMAASIGTRTLEIKSCSGCQTRGACPTCPKREFEEIFENLERGRMKFFIESQVDQRTVKELVAEAERLLSRPLPEIGVRYREIHPSAVDPAERTAAERALAAAWKRLGASYPVKLIWVQEEGAKEREDFKLWGMRCWKSHLMSDRAGGWAYKADVDKIYIVACGDPSWAARMVAHELKHLAGPEGLFDPEKNAEEFAEQFMSTFHR